MTEIETEYYKRLALQEEYGGSDKPVNRITPLVSVVTITYQHARYIRQCLDSILMQETDFPFELIIGEDGSTDGTREICIDYANRYSGKIRLFLRDRSLSQYICRNGYTIRFNGNFSRAEARGEYIASCEGDDYWLDTKKLQKQYHYLYRNSNCVLLFHDVKIDSIHKEDKNKLFKNIENRKYNPTEIIERWTIPTCSVMYRNVLSKVDKDRFLNPYMLAGDLFLWLSLSEYGEIYGDKEKMAVYRRHKGGLSVENRDVAIKKLIANYRFLQSSFNGKYYVEFNLVLFNSLLLRGIVKCINFDITGFVCIYYAIINSKYQIPHNILYDIKKVIKQRSKQKWLQLL